MNDREILKLVKEALDEPITPNAARDYSAVLSEVAETLEDRIAIKDWSERLVF